jgi:Ni,Fe-hydrogenase III large subunit/Ni,Fe-hydrogenase III component G
MKDTSIEKQVPEVTPRIPRQKHRERARLVTIFGRVDEEGRRRVCYVHDVGRPEYVVKEVDAESPVPSVAANEPAASWYEREIQDQYGIEITGSPDRRPLLLHENWPDGFHPMVDSPTELPSRDFESGKSGSRQYRFLPVQGEGITEIPVGPVHAGIIEPGHFRFSVVGDRVLHLELRHFYTHKGTERLFQGCPVLSGPLLAESVSGDNCFAHAVAYCQAVEAAFRVSIPPRAAALRLAGLELERAVAHIGDVGALCNDVGFVVGAARGARLKEALLQASAQWIGTRYWRAIATPGGIRRDVRANGTSEFLRILNRTKAEFAELSKIVLETPSVQNRFDAAGILKNHVARDLGVVGLVARASGVDIDVRRDHPYGLYGNIQLKVPVLHYGDVMARARIRVEEADFSAGLIEQTVSALPTGPICETFDPTEPAQTYSAVESPRGELFYWLESQKGAITRCHIKSPSFQNWPALPFAVVGNVIADFPLVNKSFNLSYSGCDR